MALNQTVNESTMDNDKKKKQEAKVTSVVPDPIDVSALNEKWRGKLRILNRLTFICSNSTKAHTVVQFYIIKIWTIYFESGVIQVLKYLVWANEYTIVFFLYNHQRQVLRSCFMQ